VIETLEEQGPLDSRAEKVKAALDLQIKAGVDIEAVRAAAAAEPDNWELQLALADALVGRQEYVDAFEICLNLVSRDRKNTGEKARALMVEVFRALPDDSPLTSEYRRRLASVLY
jgi:putative thioredoxin